MLVVVRRTGNHLAMGHIRKPKTDPEWMYLRHEWPNKYKTIRFNQPLLVIHEWEQMKKAKYGVTKNQRTGSTFIPNFVVGRHRHFSN
jgi:hypothetical protein